MSTGDPPATPDYGGLQRRLFQFLQVPVGPPELPPGASRWTRSFRADPAYLSYLTLGWLVVSAMILGVAGFVAVLGLGLGLETMGDGVLGPLLAVGALLVGVTLVTIQGLGLRLRYDATWYVMTDQALRNRRGLWVIQENTVSFDNVQNLSVRQGPIQRLFGIQDLVVETAAAGSSTGSNQEAQARALRVEGIRDAEELRDRIAERMRLVGDSGLGRDRSARTAERPVTPAGNGPLSPAHLQLLREIKAEVQRLNSA
ncbi:MAG: PH domain-containing protein [Gemmatimonadales bacterium]|nr:MAG: PH domain-containing protein [Gemmatimonadales bacterium]